MFKHACRVGDGLLGYGFSRSGRARTRAGMAVVVLLVAAVAQLVLPAITRSASTVTYQVVADTYVSESNHRRPHGDRRVLKVDGGGRERFALLRFKVGPSSSPIGSVKLRLHARSDAKLGVAVRLVNRPWSEQAATFDNAPTPGTLVGHSHAIESGEWVEIDVTSLVARADALRDGGSVSVALTHSPFYVVDDHWEEKDKKRRSFGSRESGEPAELVIESGDGASSAPPSTVVPSTTVPRATTTTTSAPRPPAPSPTPTPAPRSGPISGVWISAQELAALPMSGPAWESVINTAEGTLGAADVSNQDSHHGTEAMATALAAVRTGRADLRAKAEAAVVSAINTEEGARWLAIGRNLGAYVIAADVLGLRADGNPNSNGTRVQAWLARFLTRTLAHNNSGAQITLRQSAWASGSNASAEEGFVHAAIAAYLGDRGELAWAWDGFRRYAGDRTSPHRMNANDPSWQFRPDDPVGIQDPGATKNGCRLDGAIGNDMSRGGAFSCTPGYTGYPWVGLEGAVPAAVVLDRKGYPAFTHVQSAIRRAFDYLWHVRNTTGNAAWFDGDRGRQIVYLVNRRYGTNFPVQLPTGQGRTVGFTDWTHSR
jgi:hypothetical protein